MSNIKNIILSDLAYKRKYNNLISGRLDLRNECRCSIITLFHLAHDENFKAIDNINNKLVKNANLNFNDLIQKSDQYNNSTIAIRIINNFNKQKK